MTSRAKLIIFIFLATVCALFYAVIIVQRRVPTANDTCLVLEQQYVYFNEIVLHHQIPFWFPFIENGMVGNYLLTIQLTLLTPLFWLLALTVKGLNYLYLYYAGMWFEEMVFLLGILLLGSVYYRRWEAVLFAGLTAFGTSIWYPQIFWGLNFYYLVPLELFCLHRFLETKSGFYVTGAVLVFFAGFIGNVAYESVFIVFILSIYLLTWRACFGSCRDRLLSWLFTPWVWVAAVLCLATALGIFYVRFADDQIAYLLGTRLADKSVPLDLFLWYGGGVEWQKLFAFFCRDTSLVFHSDQDLYAGFATVFFAVLGVFASRRKERWPVVMAVAVVFTFSCGTLVSVIFYKFFPLGRVFRHIGLTATVAKLFLIFAAGFGVEAFFDHLREGKYRQGLWWAALAGGLLFLGLGFGVTHNDPLRWLGPVAWKAVDAAAIGLTLLAAGCAMIWFSAVPQRLKRLALSVFIFGVVGLELGAYKYALVVERMPRVPEQFRAVFKPAEYPFPVTRKAHTEQHLSDSSRLQVLWPVYYATWMDSRIAKTVNELSESFFFTDTLQSAFRTDYALVPFARFVASMRAAQPWTVNNVYARYAGVTEFKIGVFTAAYYLPSDAALAREFSRPGFDPATLWTTAAEADRVPGLKSSGLLVAVDGAGAIAPPTMVRARVWGRSFSFNEAAFNVEVRSPDGRDRLFYYADTYHPFWKAYVNGREVPVLRANIAYKAVVIPPGLSTVVFRFGHPLFLVSAGCLLALCSLTVIFVIYLGYKELRLLE